MKRIGLIVCAITLIISHSYAFSDFLTKKAEEKQTEVLSEKKTKLDESNFWESKEPREEEQLSSEKLLKDDDNKLFAPPPGEEGNPQKIVTPLGSGEILFFLLLSILVIGRCLYRKSKLAV